MAGALIGALRVSLSAETSAFEQGMKRAQKSANTTAGYIRTRFGSVGASIKSSLTGLVAGLTIGALARAGKEALEYAGSLGETAAQLGVTTRELQNFRYAAGQNGASVEEADKALGKFSLSISKARSGSAEIAKAFAAVGVKLSDLGGKSKSDLLGQVADGMNKTGGASANAAAGVAIFGKGFQKIIPTLDLGSKGISDLARANEELGGVLSDEQIQNADRTADKIAQLTLVLKTQIAGVVADNADAIFKLATAFGYAASKAADFVNQIGRIGTEGYPVENPLTGQMVWVGGPGPSMGGRSITTKLPPAKKVFEPSLPQFLGSNRKGKTDHTAEEAARKLYQYQLDEMRAQEDILQSKRDLADDYVEQAALEIAILDSQRAQKAFELQHEVQAKDINQAQADRLLALYDQKDALDRQKVLDDQEAKRAEGYAKLDQDEFDRKRTILELHANLAETAAERRKVELDLLELAYQAKKQALQNILETSKDFVELTNARRDLAQLDKEHALDRAGVLQQTRGPLEDYLASLPTTAAKANEALEQLQVQGMEGFLDSVLALSDGLGSATDSLLQTLKQFLLGLARLELQKLLGGALQGGGGGFGGILGSIGSLFGGGTNYSSQFNADVSGINFASGGSGIFRGLPGRDNNVLSMNGIPFANVSYGERMTISHDGREHAMGRGGNVYMTVNTPDANSFRRSDGQTVRSLKRRLA